MRKRTVKEKIKCYVISPSAFEIFKKINQTKTKRINQKPSLSFHFAYYSINSILSFKVEVISNSTIYIGPRIRGKSSVWSTICTLNTSTAVGVINKKKQNTHARKKKYKSKNKTNEIKTTPKKKTTTKLHSLFYKQEEMR